MAERHGAIVWCRTATSGVIIPGLALPYRAKVVVGDTERVPLTPPTNGDCNACHTQVGTHGARGRIILP